MTSQTLLVFGVLGATIVLFVMDRLRSDVVALMAVLALILTGLLTSEQALAGFANPLTLTIALLFVVGGGLFRTGVADLIGRSLLLASGNSEARLLVVVMIGAGVLSGFLSNTGTTAVLLPAIVSLAWRIGSRPSRLLIPLAFAAQIGGMLTLIGTPPNIVVTDLLAAQGLRPFGFFEFAPIGVVLLIAGVLFMLTLGQRLLPDRASKSREAQSIKARELTDTYRLPASLFRMRVRRGSSLVGQTLAQSGLGRDFDVSVVGHVARRGQTRAVDRLTPDTVIRADDVLMVRADEDALQRAAATFNLGIQPAGELSEDELLSREIGLAEVLLTQRSTLNGKTLAEANFANKYAVQVLGVLRLGQPVGGQLSDARLRFGDALLVRGTWREIEVLGEEVRDFVVVGQPEAMLPAAQLHPRAPVAIAALIGMLILITFNVVPTVVATLLAAVAMILGGCLTMEEAYASTNWESVVLIACMLPMSTALQQTGAADFIAQAIVGGVGPLGPLALLAGLFLLTMVLTQFISNTATTVLVAPIAFQAATGLGVSPHAALMAVAVGASAAFATPIATPVNTLVLTPGGYHFRDFAKVGLPLQFIFLLIAITVVPLLWPL